MSFAHLVRLKSLRKQSELIMALDLLSLNLTDAQLRAVSAMLCESQQKHNAELLHIRAAVKRETDKLRLISADAASHRLCDRLCAL
jgi:hypothetical protein